MANMTTRSQKKWRKSSCCRFETDVSALWTWRFDNIWTKGEVGALGQVWYLIESIPDLCTITYFVWVQIVFKGRVKKGKFEQRLWLFLFFLLLE